MVLSASFTFQLRCFMGMGQSLYMYRQLIVLLEVFDYDSKEYAIQNQGYNNNNNNNYNNNVRGTITIKKTTTTI